MTHPTLCSMYLCSGTDILDYFRWSHSFFQTIEGLFQIITIYFIWSKLSTYFRWSQCKSIDYGQCRGSEGGWDRLHEWHHRPQCWGHKVSDYQVSMTINKNSDPLILLTICSIPLCQADIIARSQFDAGENVWPSVPPLSRWRKKDNYGRQGSLYPNYAHLIYISIICLKFNLICQEWGEMELISLTETRSILDQSSTIWEVASLR